MKKLLTLTLAIILLLGFAACGSVGPAEIQDTSQEATTEPATTVPVSTVLQLAADGKLRSKDLKLFYETYQDTMLELAEVMLELLEALPPDSKLDFGIYRTDDVFFNPYYYTDQGGSTMAFDKELEEKIIAYHSMALRETGYDPVIDTRMRDGKRTIAFYFSSEDSGGGSIIYMPDGHVYLGAQSPEEIEWMRKIEVKLAENWYSYLV